MSSPASPGSTPALLPALDLAVLATSLGLRLRSAGVDISVPAIETFARALHARRPADRRALYWTGRLTLVHHQRDLATFDAVFAAVFGDAMLGPDPADRARTRPAARTPRPGPRSAPDGALLSEEPGSGGALPWLQLAAVTHDEQRHDGPDAVSEPLPSRLDAVADVPLGDLDPDDLALLEDWLRARAPRWPTRVSRRTVDHPSGRRVSLRRTLTHARRTGFEAVQLHRERSVRKPRRLVLVCDVSRSMQPYAAAYLHFMRAAAVATRAEVFAFSTSLTRLTVVLGHRSPQVAVEQADQRVLDRFGGTRIAANLRALLRSPHGQSVRGAVVLIASDGWDSDDPAELARVMARLSRRAHRIVWMNPRAEAPGYAPLVGALTAALPYCDAHLPARTVRDLAAVLDAITYPEALPATPGAAQAARVPC